MATRVRSTTVAVGDMVFDCLVSGPHTGEPVLLLHGFPQTPDCWRGVIGRLAAEGRHCVAPAQRGYSPGARPQQTSAYAPDHLVGDALAIAVAFWGDQAFHLVGHDLGGLLGWLLAARQPQRLRTLSIVSTPHPAAYARALVGGMQMARSLYIPWFRVPALPERVFTAGGAAGLRRFLRAAGLDDVHASRYATALSRREAMAAALDWYRAWPVGLARTPVVEDVPTLLAWGARDPAISRGAAEGTRAYVHAPYAFRPLPEAGHWIPEMHADPLSDMLVAHLGPIRPAVARTRGTGGA
jgi:pimeloyl-ACP methyl ester carboxylesterase